MAVALQPPMLRGSKVHLEPLTPDHAEDLVLFATPEIFRYHYHWRACESASEMRELVEWFLGEHQGYCFAIRDLERGRVVGSTSYGDYRPEHRGIEIGWTWIAKPFQGTHVNPEIKLLMLRYAFKDLGCIRVQLKTDALNAQSRAAIEKLGAKLDGILRNHVIYPDGRTRDTAMYSIVDAEWPTVERMLRARTSA